MKYFPVYILPTNYSVQQLLLEGTGVRPRRKVRIFQRFCLTSQAMDECLHVWPKLDSLQMRATMSAEGNLSCFELFAVPLEAIGTSRLVIEPMAITSIVQLDAGTFCHLRSRHFSSVPSEVSTRSIVPKNIEDLSASDTWNHYFEVKKDDTQVVITWKSMPPRGSR